jgi:hypothetical protein
MKTKLVVLSIASFLILLVSCNKDDDSQTPLLPTSTGKLTGKVMSRNGTKPIGGAIVFVLNDQSKLYYTRTDASGNFSLNAPTGSRDLNIQTGGGMNFRTVIHVDIVKGQTIAIDPTATRLQQVANMAYVAGSYDEVQDVVTGLGYNISAITNADLTNYNTISQYDIIFLNCGAKDHDNAVVDTNLANFVTNGGSLYTSDYAVAYLTGGNYSSSSCGQAFGFIPDDKLCTLTAGTVSTIAGAQITDTALAASMGFSTLDIVYDLPQWEKINNFDPTFWDVMVNDPASGQPLMIKTNNFSGGTAGTEVGQSGADEGWMTICHKEFGSESFTITIPESEWAMHAAHGDSVGSCSNANNSGTIYFTTFHNHAGGNIGNAGLILQYVILNL